MKNLKINGAKSAVIGNIELDDVKINGTAYDKNGNPINFSSYALVKMTQAEYDALAEKDENTLYIIVG